VDDGIALIPCQNRHEVTRLGQSGGAGVDPEDQKNITNKYVWSHEKVMEVDS